MSSLDFCSHFVKEACSSASSRPVLLVAAGASGAVLAGCALVSYCAAGSPRWKGAPAFAEPDGFGCGRDCRTKEPAATSTMVPSGTSAADPSVSVPAVCPPRPMGSCCGHSDDNCAAAQGMNESLASHATQDSDGDRATISQNTPSVRFSRHSSLQWLCMEASSDPGTDALEDSAVDFRVRHRVGRAATPILAAQLDRLEARCAEQLRPPIVPVRTAATTAETITTTATTTTTTATVGTSFGATEATTAVSGTGISPMAQAKVTTAAAPSNRRTDDVYVRHRGDGLTSYSLSLTYHDAHGSTHTVNTHPLPPLSLAPRDPAATNKSRAPADPIPLLRTSVSPPSLLKLQESPVATPTCLTARRERNAIGFAPTLVPIGAPGHLTAKGASASVSVSGSGSVGDDLVAPLPPFVPAAETRLQGVVGSRGEYRIGAFLGGGWCGKVYECLNTETGEFFAVKELVFEDSDPKLRQRLRQLRVEKEVLTLAAQHRMPWIVGFHGAEKRGHSALMFLEYCARGSLLDYVMSHGVSSPASPPSIASAASIAPGLHAAREVVAVGTGISSNPSAECISRPGADGRLLPNTLPPPLSRPPSPSPSPSACARRGVPEMPMLPLDEVRRFTQQTLEALCFMHSNGYVHLDVKTANILVTADSEARLADFGCSMRLERTEVPSVPYAVLADVEDVNELRGTAQYMAPEMIRFERGRIGTPADVWSLGCVVMEVATGAAPWSHVASEKMRLLYRVASAREDLPLPPGIVCAAAEAKQRMTQWRAQREDMDAAEETGEETEAAWNLEDFCAWARSSKRYQHLAKFVALEDFLTACVHIRPEERYSCEELLRHPFLTDCS